MRRLVIGLLAMSLGFGGFTYVLFTVAQNASEENCETSNEDRELLLVFLRRELAPDDTPAPETADSIPVPPDATPALVQVLEYVNAFILGSTEPDPQMDGTILDRAERLFRERDC